MVSPCGYHMVQVEAQVMWCPCDRSYPLVTIVWPIAALQRCQFGCAPPTAYFFVNHLAGMAGCGPRATALAQYLTELTMIDGEGFMHFQPSIIASAAVALSRHTMGMAAWEDSMVSKTGYNVDDFKECLIRLHETFERAPQMAQQAVREKYKNAR